MKFVRVARKLLAGVICSFGCESRGGRGKGRTCPQVAVPQAGNLVRRVGGNQGAQPGVKGATRRPYLVATMDVGRYVAASINSDRRMLLGLTNARSGAGARGALRANDRLEMQCSVCLILMESVKLVAR